MTRDTFYHVDELKVKIEQLLNSRRKSLSFQCREILKLVYKQMESFEEIAKISLKTSSDKAIRSEVYELRSIVSKFDSSSSEEENDDDEEDDDDNDDEDDDSDEEEDYDDDADGVQFSTDDVEKLKERIQSFSARLKMEEKRCVDGIYNCFPEEEEEEEDNRDAVTSKMIGARDMYEELKDKIMGVELISIVGMPGIGKTTLANKYFHDPMIVKFFDHRVWIRVGKKCQVKDIPRRILAEIDPDSLLTLPGEDEEAVHKQLKAILKSESYLIVLDDVWDRYISYLWNSSQRYGCNELKHPFLHSKRGSRILLTSRLQLPSEDRGGINNYEGCTVQMRLLSKKESWDLLCDKVFCSKGTSCPPELEKAGKKISEDCEGLPLTIIAVAHRLSGEEMSTPEYWNEVAAKKRHPLFMDAYDEISKVLLPSYTYLPPLLQMCFLFIGLFPQGYEIPRSRLINLWLSDRFLELNININDDSDANDCLEELVSNNVLRVYKQSTFNVTHIVKTCGLHSSLWHLSNKKAKETKFALVLMSPSDCFGEGMEGHHRLSILSNVLFGMKDVHESIEDNCASARSLLCFGPYHQYQVPLCFQLKLLKELDAHSIRFYEFPMEVLKLVRLTYLSLTSNGMIPTSISQLQLLEFFIVDQHQSIKSGKKAQYLPMEIWSLQKLKHLQVMGSDLPNPRGASLDDLSTLSNVSAHSCTKAVLKGVPNLKKLSIRIELAPHDDGNSLSCFTHISRLRILWKLKCVIVNPQVVPRPVLFSSFPTKDIVELCLSGLGYPWKEMRKISSLPHLTVLKIKNYAFQGPVWEVNSGFTKLISLVIEDTNVVCWKFGRGAFVDLMSIKIKSCYILEKIDGEFGEYLRMIELVDCHPSCVAKMRKVVQKVIVSTLRVHSSWEDGKRKTTHYVGNGMLKVASID